MKKFRPQVRSKHPSHDILRTHLPLLPVRSIVRLGSPTVLNDGKSRVEVNSSEVARISGDKLLMKEKFTEAEVKTAPWFTASSVDGVLTKLTEKEIPYPIVAKNRWGSRGIGNTLINNAEELKTWASNRNFNHYIFEKYMSYLLEYRLHVTKDGCFYACRKALKADVPKEQSWQRHVDTTTWYLETNEKFKKPNSWDKIVSDCVKALNTIGADILCFDIRVQGEKDAKGKTREEQNWFLIESNSAPSMSSPNGSDISICAQKYIEIIPQIILEKAGVE